MNRLAVSTFIELYAPSAWNARDWDHLEQIVLELETERRITNMMAEIASGIREPIEVVEPQNKVLNGHHRVVAARRLGLQIPYVVDETLLMICN